MKKRKSFLDFTNDGVTSNVLSSLWSAWGPGFFIKTLRRIFLILIFSRWSWIARSLPGRTDNEIKNYWRTHLRKKIEIEEQGMLQFCSVT